MKAKSYKIAASLYLVAQALSKGQAVPTVESVNHVLIIDCSGSMTYDLPRIREDLKKKLPKLVGEGDTVSIIWFSGRGEFGTLLEGEKIASLKDLQDVNKAIDRWLRPVGMTGFKEPLLEASALVERVKKKNPGSFSLFFFTDGYENQWTSSEVLAAVEKAAGGFSAATFVEGGYYCNRGLMTQMAEKAGGEVILSESFDKFQPIFEAAMKRRVGGGKKVKEKLGASAIGGFAFVPADGCLTTFSVTDGVVMLPENVDNVFYLSTVPVGTDEGDLEKLSKGYATPKRKLAASMAPGSDAGTIIGAAYAAVSLFGHRMKPDLVYPLLKGLGDVQFIDTFSKCFGKDKYAAFVDLSKSAAFGAGQYVSGWDSSRVPKEDAFTVLHLLALLESDENNRVLVDSPEFKYSRIGRGTEDVERLSEAEVAECKQLAISLVGSSAPAKEAWVASSWQRLDDMLSSKGYFEDAKALIEKRKAETDATKAKELDKDISEFFEVNGPSFPFTADPAPEGYPVTLVYAEERPNVSIRVQKMGTVDLSGRIPKELKKVKGKVQLPEEFPTWIYRNYTVVKDGIINIERLPIRVTMATYLRLVKEGVTSMDGRVPSDKDPMVDMVVDLKSLPVINRKMVSEVSAKELFELEWKLTQARAIQKVFNSITKEKFDKKSEGFEAAYGPEVAAWLSARGITDGGFNPPRKQSEAKDVYYAKVLNVSLKGFSSIPSLNDVRKKLASGKPATASQSLLVPTIKRVDDFIASDAYKKASNQDKLLETWLRDEAKAAKREVQKCLREKSGVVYSVIVGQTWFKEFSSLDENTLKINVGGTDLDCKVEMTEPETKI